MKQLQTHPDIYQLRIVLRGISPLIWRRLLVRSDTTLAQLHRMLQILFEWSNEHLHRFHIFGKDYGSDGADTQHVSLNAFGFHQGERFRYVYNFYAQWQWVVYLSPAGKYKKPAWRLSQEQKGLDERPLKASQRPSHPW